MGVRVRFPGSFHLRAGNEVAVEGDTVGQVLRRLAENDPDLTPHLCGEDGAFRPTVQVYINDEHIRFRQGWQTPLRDGDLVYIVPTVMGG